MLRIGSIMAALGLLLSPSIVNAEQSLAQFKAQWVGHYTHYDVVAYEQIKWFVDLKSYVITYGLTEFFLDQEGELWEQDTFCHAGYQTNLNMSVIVPDAFTRAIKPRLAKVEIRREPETGEFYIYRGATPTFIGIKIEDPLTPLPSDPKDPRISDDDHDGKPGVSIKVRVLDLFDSEIYLARREIFEYTLYPYGDQTLSGFVRDSSEQLVVGSPLPFLRMPMDPKQSDPQDGRSPITLNRLPSIYHCDQLMAEKAQWFPPEPDIKEWDKALVPSAIP